MRWQGSSSFQITGRMHSSLERRVISRETVTNYIINVNSLLLLIIVNTRLYILPLNRDSKDVETIVSGLWHVSSYTGYSILHK